MDVAKWVQRKQVFVAAHNDISMAGKRNVQENVVLGITAEGKMPSKLNQLAIAHNQLNGSLYIGAR